jgi:hypothetical protein
MTELTQAELTELSKIEFASKLFVLRTSQKISLLLTMTIFQKREILFIAILEGLWAFL